MTNIRAFVGHSFDDEDEQVVRSFLDYFREVAETHPSFSWQNARKAEPRQLAEKVLSLVADKNVFIAICTLKEYALARGLVSGIFSLIGIRLTRSKNFQGKTSDWITQEIGLAVGRDMKVILLLEDGVREPGGLQGSVEYIRFNRNAPQKAFTQILQMINTLDPKPLQTVATIPALGPPESEENEPSASLIPTAEWSPQEYKRALGKAIKSDNEEALDQINTAYLATPDAAKEGRADAWEALKEFGRLLWGKGADLGKLKALSEANPTNVDMRMFLARGYAKYGEPAKAGETYLLAAEIGDDGWEKIHSLGGAAKQFAKAGNLTASASAAERMKQIVVAEPAQELDVLLVLKELAEEASDEFTGIAVMERIIELTPEDVSVRFDLSRKHSDAGNDDLALINYLKIPEPEREDFTWNNLGVEYDRLGITGKAVTSFKKSREMGNTLAMGNLGNKFLGFGFLDEAREECNEAIKLPNFHESVGVLVSAIRDTVEKENKDEQEVIAKAKRKADFYRELGRAVAKPTPPNLASSWQGPNCALATNVIGSAFTASGTYSVDTSSGLALAVYPDLPKQPPVTYKVEYLGKFSGRMITGTIVRGPSEKAPASIFGLSGGPVSPPFLAYVTADGTQLMILEDPSSQSAKFNSIVKR